MSGRDNFDLDLRYGEAGELFISDVLKCGRTGNIRGEVKRDGKFINTGNFYVETECLHRDNIWRLSGLSISEADYWFFVFGDAPGFLAVSASLLKRAVSLSGRKAEHLTGENPTRGVLIGCDDIRKAISAYAERPI